MFKDLKKWKFEILWIYLQINSDNIVIEKRLEKTNLSEYKMNLLQISVSAKRILKLLQILNQ